MFPSCCKFNSIIYINTQHDSFLPSFRSLFPLCVNCQISSVEVFPKFLQLKDLKFKVNSVELNDTFYITKSATKIQSLSMFDAIFYNNIFKYLKHFRSLTSLSLIKCNNVFHSSRNYENLDWFKKLRKLELIEVKNGMLQILKVKCIEQLTDLKIVYTQKHDLNVKMFFKSYMLKRDNYPSLYHNGKIIKKLG